MEEVFSLSYLPLMVRLRCLEEVSLPSCLGSTLHGVVGWALWSHRNAYKYIYENRRLDKTKQVIVNPYVIDPPRYQNIYRKGDELRFQLCLIGNGIHYAEELINALTETRIFCLGAERKKFELMEIMHGQNLSSIWKQEKLNYNAISSIKLSNEIQSNAGHCSIQLLTPLRIRRGGELVTEIDFATIIRNISRRIEELTNRYGGVIDLDEVEIIKKLAEEIETKSGSLHLYNIERYSNRRRSKMDFSGMLGSLVFEGDMCPFIPWLHAAQILHIGRNTTFGCGKIEVVYW